MAFTLKDCCYDGSHKLVLKDTPTQVDVRKELRSSFEDATAQNTLQLGLLQDKLYAQGSEGVVVLLQAMDAAGKDSTIKHVMSGVNPQGVFVQSFKQPSQEELAHDFLWRAAKNLPRRGEIALFNRSYYEDVLVVRVHELWKTYKMPARCINDSKEEFFSKRYQDICNFENYLYHNGYRVVKIFLHVSREEQKKRFLERIDDEAKNWKFSDADLRERQLWSSYMDAYEKAINATATTHAPWYVIPADRKWYTRWLVSELLVQTLKSIDPRYPEFPDSKRAELAACKEQLLAE